MNAANPAPVTTRSIDPGEVRHYSRLAETWWDAQGPFWPLHRLNEVRVPFIRDEIVRNLEIDDTRPLPLEGLSILDIGCGGGILAESMTRLGARVQGIDVVEKNIVIACRHARQSGLDIDYGLVTAEALAETGATFDVVLNMEVVEHVADLDGFMAACCALVRPGGTMFVATINRTWPAFLVAIIGAEYVLRWMPRGTHRYNHLRKPTEIHERLLAGGLVTRRVTGVAVNPFTKLLHLARSTRINYMLSAVKADVDDLLELT